MSCETYERMISRQVDGELDPRSGEVLKRHLDGCAACRKVYESMVALEPRVKFVAHWATDPALPARVKERLAATRGDRRTKWLVPVWRQVAVFATLTAVALGIGNVAGRSISEAILDHRPPERGIELLVTERPSISDAMLTLAREENPR